MAKLITPMESRPVNWVNNPHQQRPDHRSKLAEDIEKSKVLVGAVRRDQLAKYERDNAWMPPWTVPTRKAMHQNNTWERANALGLSGFCSILKPMKKPTTVMQK